MDAPEVVLDHVIADPSALAGAGPLVSPKMHAPIDPRIVDVVA